MIHVPGYCLNELLHDNGRTMVYRAVRDNDDTPVILKMLDPEATSPLTLNQFKREYAYVKRFTHPHIVSPHKQLLAGKYWFIEFADTNGVSLDKWLINSKKISVSEFLPLALQLVSAVKAIHAQGIIHKDINPANIVWNENTQTLELIDFGISSELQEQQPSSEGAPMLEGTLAYMAPEQTGRMNRNIDFRSDLYALGATFFHMLCGQRPFEIEDPLALIHAHLAVQPDWHQSAFAGLPARLQQLIRKLLEKDADQRYDSIEAIEQDLLACLSADEPPGTASDTLFFTSTKLSLPRQVYGRQQEIKELYNHFLQAAEGDKAWIQILGEPGIGKSVLAFEFQRMIAERDVFFTYGKFDQIQRDKPFSALLKALQEILLNLASEPADTIHHWNEKLTHKLGSAASALFEWLPELQFIIGDHTPAPALPPQESQNRLNALLKRLIHCFCDAKHPLVIFLDDLQWADISTLRFIESLLVDPTLHHFLLIGAFRPQEVGSEHPLRKLNEKLAATPHAPTQLTLLPLSLKHTQQLLTDTLHMNAQDCHALASLCLRKTHGNPFFLFQFLKTIHHAGFLVFSSTKKCWVADIARIEGAGYTDNVIDLMLLQMQRLPDKTQDILQLAACVGHRFSLLTLSQITGFSTQQIHQHLLPTLHNELITIAKGPVRSNNEGGETSDAEYNFSHDKVQQAAYALIAENLLPERHHKIGNMLLKGTYDIIQDPNFFPLWNI